MPAKLLITRPIHMAVHVAAELSHIVERKDIIFAPVFEIHPLKTVNLTSNEEAVLFTSQNAIPQAAIACTQPKAFCVGKNTAKAAHKAGFHIIHTAPCVEDILKPIIKSSYKDIIYLHGTYHTQDISPKLSFHGINATRHEVYEQKEREWSVHERQAIFEADRLIVPIYSPRSAALLSSRLVNYKGDVELISISKNTFENWCAGEPNSYCICAAPSAEEMYTNIKRILRKYMLEGPTKAD